MKQLFAMMALAGVLAGCAQGPLAIQNNRPVFDGQTFRASAKSVDRRDRKEFVVTVRNVSKSPDGARMAAQHAGISYCIKYFGTSDILWPLDPTDEGVTLPVDGDVLQLSAECQD